MIIKRRPDPDMQPPDTYLGTLNNGTHQANTTQFRDGISILFSFPLFVPLLPMVHLVNEPFPTQSATRLGRFR